MAWLFDRVLLETESASLSREGDEMCKVEIKGMKIAYFNLRKEKNDKSRKIIKRF